LTLRPPSPGKLIGLVRDAPGAALHFVGDRLRRHGSDADLAAGEGAIVDSGLGKTALYRDEAGRRHTLSARCPHLGCLVRWNAAEGTWDCPCHGSRFAPTGEVIEGPAAKPLERRAVSG